MMARALATLLAVLALVGGGYRWGDSAATNRHAAEDLQRERAKTISQALANHNNHQDEVQNAYDAYRISAAYQQGISDGAATQKAVMARVRSGDLRLSIPTRPAAGAGIGTEAAAATGGRCDGPARAQLSDEAAEFLTGLASEADGVVRQLSACQADLAAAINACNRKHPSP